MEQRQDTTREYTVMLTEKEMQSIANCMTNLFNRIAAEKKTVPPAIADSVMCALLKFKVACNISRIIPLGEA